MSGGREKRKLAIKKIHGAFLNPLNVGVNIRREKNFTVIYKCQAHLQDITQ